MARILFVSPFESPFDGMYENVFRPHLAREGHQVSRPDKFASPGSVMDTVFVSIVNSDIIIADATGANANVFYEIGIAHSHRKPVILLKQAGQKMPFDVAHLRYVTYNLDEEGWGKLCVNKLLKAIQAVSGGASALFRGDALLGTYVSGLDNLLLKGELLIRNAASYFFATRLTPNAGIIPRQSRYFEATRERIQGDLPDYRRLIRITSRDDLELAISMLKEYQSCSNFQMRLLKSSSIHVNFELFVSDGRWSMLSFAVDQAGGSIETGLLFDDERIESRWRAHFLNLWSHPDTTVIKPAGRVSAEQLEQALRALDAA
jgi:hypothetical protein